MKTQALIRQYWPTAALFAGLIAVWQLAVSTTGIREYLLPAPLSVWDATHLYEVEIRDGLEREGVDLDLHALVPGLSTPFASHLGIEHSTKESLPAGETRKYGTTAITFYRAESSIPST